MKICPPGRAKALTICGSASRWIRTRGRGVGGGILNDALPDLFDPLLVGRARVETAILIGHFRSGLQPYGDLLIRAHADVLDVLGDGVGRLRAEIGDERDADEDGGHYQPAAAAAAATAAPAETPPRSVIPAPALAAPSQSAQVRVGFGTCAIT